MAFELSQHDNVFLLTMNEDDNRFNPDSLAAIHDAMDVVENHEAPAALVTTGTGKYYSNGLDLDKAMSDDYDFGLTDIALASQQLMARTLTFSRPTVAALNGHCMAAAAMWSLAHDFRVMRADRGYWGLPEVSIRIPFTRGMSSLIQARLSPQTAHLAMTTGYRFGGTEAAERDIVDAAVAQEDVVGQAIAHAAALADNDPATLKAIKTEMYGPVVEALLGT